MRARVCIILVHTVNLKPTCLLSAVSRPEDQALVHVPAVSEHCDIITHYWESNLRQTSKTKSRLLPPNPTQSRVCVCVCVCVCVFVYVCASLWCWPKQRAVSSLVVYWSTISVSLSMEHITSQPSSLGCQSARQPVTSYWPTVSMATASAPLHKHRDTVHAAVLKGETGAGSYKLFMGNDDNV